MDMVQHLPRWALVVSWILQLVVTAILGQTLYFKFTGAAETVALFEVLGAEPAGRYATASAELLAVVLLLIPRVQVYGAIVALIVVSGAILSHLTRLGISIDPAALGKPALEPLKGPSLFIMAVAVLVCSLGILFLRRGQIPVVGAMLAGTDGG